VYAQGTADNFYKSGQLLPENFVAVAKEAGFGDDTVSVREREGYDHSYYFVSAVLLDGKFLLMGCFVRYRRLFQNM
jgi:S-formylglutathione hydrolase FrmB